MFYQISFLLLQFLASRTATADSHEVIYTDSIDQQKHLWGKFKSDYSKAHPLLNCFSMDENSVHTISCPYKAFVRSIDFASYGTPTGSCGAFSKGSCDSSYSMSVVTNKCLHKATCAVSAQNSVFGDPCPGTPKHLYIQATCY